MTVHELRSLPPYFEATWRGEKTFDIRQDDRGFQRGDSVVLREWDARAECSCERGHDATACERYSGRSIAADIGFVTASMPGRRDVRGFIGHGYVVMSLLNVTTTDMREIRKMHAMAKAATPEPPR